MEDLPVEILPNILKYLTSLGDRKAFNQVCRMWHSVCGSSVLHDAVVTISSEQQLLIFIDVPSEESWYRHFVFHNMDITNQSGVFWKRFGKHMLSLTFRQCNIQERTFAESVSECNNLKTLVIENCPELFIVGTFLNENQPELRRLCFKCFRSLTCLNLGYNRYLSDASLINVLSLCTSLKTLNLSGSQICFHSALYRRFYPEGHFVPSPNVLTFVIILRLITDVGKNLTSLSFSDTIISSSAVCQLAQLPNLRLTGLQLNSCYQLRNQGLTTLAELQQTMTELDLGRCPRVTDDALEALCTGLPHLTSLCLQHCSAITDQGLVNLSKLKKLGSLDISHCYLVEGPGLVDGVCTLPLTELRLSHLGNINESVLIKLSVTFPQLRLLDLDHCHNAVTDTSIQSVLSNNTRLRKLVVTKCDRLSDCGLTGMGHISPTLHDRSTIKLPLGSKAEQEIVRDAKLKEAVRELCEEHRVETSLHNLKGLQVLLAGGCVRVTDVTLLHAFRLQELKILDLSECQQVTDEGLIHLATTNSSIEELSLNPCDTVSDLGVVALCKGLRRMTKFVLGSSKVTANITDVIAEYSKQLKYLDLKDCEQMMRIPDEKVQLLRDELPHLRQLII